MARILVVDDDEAVRIAMRRILEAGGHVVTDSANGKSALKALGDSPPPDVLLSDLAMPEVDGFELLRALRTLPHRPKVIVASGFLSGELLDIAKALGAALTLQKPFTREQLLEAIAQVLRTG